MTIPAIHRRISISLLVRTAESRGGLGLFCMHLKRKCSSEERADGEFRIGINPPYLLRKTHFHAWVWHNMRRKTIKGPECVSHVPCGGFSRKGASSGLAELHVPARLRAAWQPWRRFPSIRSAHVCSAYVSAAQCSTSNVSSPCLSQRRPWIRWRCSVAPLSRRTEPLYAGTGSARPSAGVSNWPGLSRTACSVCRTAFECSRAASG